MTTHAHSAICAETEAPATPPPTPDIWTRLRTSRQAQCQRAAAQSQALIADLERDYQTMSRVGARLVDGANYVGIAHALHEASAGCSEALHASPPFWANRWVNGVVILAGFYVATLGAPTLVQLMALPFAILTTYFVNQTLMSAHLAARLKQLFHIHLYAVYQVEDGEATAMRLNGNLSIRQATNFRLTDAVLGYGPNQVRPTLAMGLEARDGAPDRVPRWMFVHVLGNTCRVSHSRVASPPYLHPEQGERAQEIDLVARDLVYRLEEASPAPPDLPDPERLRAAWQSVVLAPKTLDALVSQQVLFMTGDPACGRGLLLYGPPGTGKTTLARVFAESAGAEFFLLSESDLKQPHQGASAQAVRRIWEQAQKAGRAILFVDECEGVFGRRGGLESDATSAEIVRALLPLWDGLPSNATVLVIGATNRVDLLDPAIRSRFGTAIEIGAPGVDERRRMLAASLRRMALDVSLAGDPEVMQATAGLSGRDLDELARQLRRQRVGVVTPPTAADLLACIRATHQNGSAKTSARATWDTLFAPPAAVEALKDLAFTIGHSEALRQRGFTAPKGVLLYGPPGTGKTQLARTLAQEAGCKFIAASTADLKAGWVGQSGQRVKQLFADARSAAPCLLFLDEIDALAGDRSGDSDAFAREALNQMLQEIDGIVDHSDAPVVVLAATNRMAVIDPALLSRFTSKLLIDLPTAAQRIGLAEHLLAASPIETAARDRLHAFLQQAEDFSHRDVANLVQSIRAQVLRGVRATGAASLDDLAVTQHHVEAAISTNPI